MNKRLCRCERRGKGYGSLKKAVFSSGSSKKAKRHRGHKQLKLVDDDGMGTQGKSVSPPEGGRANRLEDDDVVVDVGDAFEVGAGFTSAGSDDGSPNLVSLKPGDGAPAQWVESVEGGQVFYRGESSKGAPEAELLEGLDKLVSGLIAGFGGRLDSPKALVGPGEVKRAEMEVVADAEAPTCGDSGGGATTVAGGEMGTVEEAEDVMEEEGTTSEKLEEKEEEENEDDEEASNEGEEEDSSMEDSGDKDDEGTGNDEEDGDGACSDDKCEKENDCTGADDEGEGGGCPDEKGDKDNNGKGNDAEDDRGSDMASDDERCVLLGVLEEVDGGYSRKQGVVVDLSDSSPLPKAEKHVPAECEANLASLLIGKDWSDNLVPTIEDPDFDFFEGVLSNNPKVLHLKAGRFDLTNQFFLDLATPRKWVTIMHMDVLMEHVGKIHEAALAANRAIFVAPWFLSLLVGKERAFKCARYKGRIVADSKLAAYLTGEGKKLGPDVDSVYVPMNWEGCHWVGLAINVPAWRVLVLDPNPRLKSDDEVRDIMMPIAEMLPYLIQKVCPAGYVVGHQLAPFNIERMAGVYENRRSGDCGPVSIKFMELVALGALVRVMELNDMVVDNMRKQMAMESYKDMILPLYVKKQTGVEGRIV